MAIAGLCRVNTLEGQCALPSQLRVRLAFTGLRCGGRCKRGSMGVGEATVPWFRAGGSGGCEGGSPSHVACGYD